MTLRSDQTSKTGLGQIETQYSTISAELGLKEAIHAKSRSK